MYFQTNMNVWNKYIAPAIQKIQRQRKQVENILINTIIDISYVTQWNNKIYDWTYLFFKIYIVWHNRQSEKRYSHVLYDGVKKWCKRANFCHSNIYKRLIRSQNHYNIQLVPVIAYCRGICIQSLVGKYL